MLSHNYLIFSPSEVIDARSTISTATGDELHWLSQYLGTDATLQCFSVVWSDTSILGKECHSVGYLISSITNC